MMEIEKIQIQIQTLERKAGDTGKYIYKYLVCTGRMWKIQIQTNTWMEARWQRRWGRLRRGSHLSSSAWREGSAGKRGFSAKNCFESETCGFAAKNLFKYLKAPLRHALSLQKTASFYMCSKSKHNNYGWLSTTRGTNLNIYKESVWVL